MLERIAANVASATEAVASEERFFQLHQPEALRMYFSVIVTTAKLKVCAFDPAQITITDGKLADADFHDVPYVRFRKQLSTRVGKLDGFVSSMRHSMASARERTVFVVNSDEFVSFLSEFEVDNSSLKALV